MKFRYIIPGLLALTIGLLLWRFWTTILYGAVGITAWRLFICRTMPRYARRRGPGLIESARKWVEAVGIFAIAHQVGPRQAKSTPGIPQRVWKRQASQSDEVPF